MSMTPGSQGLFRRAIHCVGLAVVAFVVLAPFSGKAFHIDDPLFVWAARHIAEHPLDFYGFRVLWYSTWEPMAEVTQNPPLGCYYLAAVGSVFGFSEIVLHWSMAIPTWLALMGAYRVAERLGAKPLAAALLTLATPVFVLSATSVMCDVPMLALWLWTIVNWDVGLRENRIGRLWLAGFLIALTTMTKYFGVCLLPLLGAYALAIDKSTWRRWLPPLAFAVLLLAGYQFLTWWVYGRGLLGVAMGYAASFGNPTLGTKFFRFFAGFSFLGGCIGAWALAAPLLNGRRWLLVLALVAAVTVIVSLSLVGLHGDPGVEQTDSPFAWHKAAYYGPQVDLLGQFVLWVVAGFALAVLCWQDWRRERDSQALLLGLWIGGTYLFAAFVNWTLNGRSVLPLVPAVAIVLIRRLDWHWQGAWPRWALPALVGPGLALAMIVAEGDRAAADAQRRAASEITADFRTIKPLWFAGHWGFQFYMMEHGAEPWDGKNDVGKPGDLIAIPDNNCNMAALNWDTEVVTRYVDPARALVTAMHYHRAAGFYAEIWGPLPFTFGPVPPEQFRVERLLKPGR
jgi:4-amino-4-deoxy-L-arabinose transferase-like glycosyltransferase